MCQLAGLCYTNSFILAPPLTLQRSLSELFWEAISQAWGPQKVQQIKHNSQLSACTFFFFSQQMSMIKTAFLSESHSTKWWCIWDKVEGVRAHSLKEWHRQRMRIWCKLVRTKSKTVEDSTSSEPWASLYTHCTILASKWHAHRCHDSSQAKH